MMTIRKKIRLHFATKKIGIKPTILCALLFFCAFSGAFGQKFAELELLSGTENIVKYGMDTTQNWWAITEPFAGRFRLTINSEPSEIFEKIETPVFSPDGEDWATFVIKDSQWHLLTRHGLFALIYNRVGNLVFSGDSRSLCFVGYRAEEAWILTLKKEDSGGKIRWEERGKYALHGNSFGEIFVNPSGVRVACVGARSGGKVVVINGKEGALYEDILSFGFRSDGVFVFAAKLGTEWRVYAGEESLTAGYDNISSVKMNRDGTAFTFVASYKMGSVAVLISDEFSQPSVGRIYDYISGLALHPTRPMIAYRASFNTQPLVVFSRTEYPASASTDAPVFSADGSELAFMGCDEDCYITINGKRNFLQRSFDVFSTNFALAPGSGTFAYNSSSSLTVRFYENKKMYSGMMVDETIPPRYNSRAGRYETLGRISQRIYLIVCVL